MKNKELLLERNETRMGCEYAYQWSTLQAPVSRFEVLGVEITGGTSKTLRGGSQKDLRAFQ